MRDLLILGTGVHALEMAEIVERVNRSAPAWNLLGYIAPDEKQVGQSCTIRQYLKIGRHSLIGMGAVVVKNVEPDSVMAGNPARKIRDNIPKEAA